MKIVKVARVGSKVQEVAMNDDCRVGECLTAAGINVGSEDDIFINHYISSLGTKVLNNDVIIVEPRKRTPLSPGLVRFINYLIEESLILENYEEYEMDDLYDDNKDFIDTLIFNAKEV